MKQYDARLREIWQGMKKRCNNPNCKSYKRYGGRGIAVCDEWREFEPFYEWAMSHGYADNLSIDRIDNNGNYEPSNCRWATLEEQANNTRKNHYLTYNGKTQTVAQWAKETGVKREMLYARIRRGMTDEEVITTPKGCGARKGITYNGQTKTLKQWAEYTGIKHKILEKRIYTSHWTIERALTEKPKERA